MMDDDFNVVEHDACPICDGTGYDLLKQCDGCDGRGYVDRDEESDW